MIPAGPGIVGTGKNHTTTGGTRDEEARDAALQEGQNDNEHDEQHNRPYQALPSEIR